MEISGGGDSLVNDLIMTCTSWLHAGSETRFRYAGLRCTVNKKRTYNGHSYTEIQISLSWFRKVLRIIESTTERPNFYVYRYSGTIQNQVRELVEGMREDTKSKLKRRQARVKELIQL